MGLYPVQERAAKRPDAKIDHRFARSKWYQRALAATAISVTIAAGTKSVENHNGTASSLVGVDAGVLALALGERPLAVRRASRLTDAYAHAVGSDLSSPQVDYFNAAAPGFLTAGAAFFGGLLIGAALEGTSTASRAIEGGIGMLLAGGVIRGQVWGDQDANDIKDKFYQRLDSIDQSVGLQ